MYVGLSPAMIRARYIEDSFPRTRGVEPYNMRDDTWLVTVSI